MKTYAWWRTAAGAALLAASGVAVAQDLALSDFGEMPLIRVAGTGRVSVSVDTASLNLGVETQAKLAEEARAKAAEAMTAMIAAVRASGIEDKDLQTQHLSLNPVFVPDSASRIAGYQAHHQLNVKVRDISRVGRIIDESLKAGGDASRMYGVGFMVDDPSAAETEARKRAYANALSKARELAGAANLTLGRPIRIIDTPAYMPGPIPRGGVAMAKMSAEAATPVASGEQEVSVTIDVVFAVTEPAPTPQ
jgi:uncharacterized protein YggE